MAPVCILPALFRCSTRAQSSKLSAIQRLCRDVAEQADVSANGGFTSPAPAPAAPSERSANPNGKLIDRMIKHCDLKHVRSQRLGLVTSTPCAPETGGLHPLSAPTRWRATDQRRRQYRRPDNSITCGYAARCRDRLRAILAVAPLALTQDSAAHPVHAGNGGTIAADIVGISLGLSIA